MGKMPKISDSEAIVAQTLASDITELQKLATDIPAVLDGISEDTRTMVMAPMKRMVSLVVIMHS